MADLDILNNNFRLLELAGAAEQIAHQGEESPEALLWRAYAEATRNYHSWISVGDFDNYALLAISDPGAGAGGGREFSRPSYPKLRCGLQNCPFGGPICIS